MPSATIATTATAPPTVAARGLRPSSPSLGSVLILLRRRDRPGREPRACFGLRRRGLARFEEVVPDPVEAPARFGEGHRAIGRAVLLGQAEAHELPQRVLDLEVERATPLVAEPRLDPAIEIRAGDGAFRGV